MLYAIKSFDLSLDGFEVVVEADSWPTKSDNERN